jgi:hypothetical protein
VEVVVVRVHILGASDLVTLMTAHRQDARSTSIPHADQLSPMRDDDKGATDDERNNRHLIGAIHISYS